jgi:hypothetical protein
MLSLLLNLCKNLSILVHRVLVWNPVFSISSPGFQKSSPGFLNDESGFFPGPGFSRVRIFFESGSESGFRIMPLRWGNRQNKRLSPLRSWVRSTGPFKDFQRLFLPIFKAIICLFSKQALRAISCRKIESVSTIFTQ